MNSGGFLVKLSPGWLKKAVRILSFLAVFLGFSGFDRQLLFCYICSRKAHARLQGQDARRVFNVPNHG